jgi:hypothetical protein
MCFEMAENLICFRSFKMLGTSTPINLRSFAAVTIFVQHFFEFQKN